MRGRGGEGVRAERERGWSRTQAHAHSHTQSISSKTADDIEVIVSKAVGTRMTESDEIQLRKDTSREASEFNFTNS